MRRSGCWVTRRRICRCQGKLSKHFRISLTVLLAMSLGAPAALLGQACKSSPLPRVSDWPVYGGQVEGDHYSPLSQINRSNVHRLREAWRFDAAEEGGLETN